MSKRPDFDRIGDMIEAATRIETYCNGVRFSDFRNDVKTQDAVVRNLEVLGEAAKGVSKELRDKYEQIPWVRIASMRDRLIHDYFGVNFEIVWDVVENDILELKSKLKKIIEG